MKNIIIYESCKGKKKKKKAHKTHLILTTYINKIKVQIMAIQINVKEWVTPILTHVDSVTQQAIPTTWDNIVLTSGDTTIFSSDTDVAPPDGLIDVVGIGAGVSSINVKARGTYKDSNGIDAVKNLETDVVVEVLLPPANATELVVDFTPAQPVP